VYKRTQYVNTEYYNLTPTWIKYLSVSLNTVEYILLK